MEYLLTVGNVRVRLSHIGEGIFGDYDANDDEDIPLLRFDVEKCHNGEWEPVDDASYCTRIEADRYFTDVIASMTVIMNEVYAAVEDGRSIKKMCERLSWMG